MYWRKFLVDKIWPELWPDFEILFEKRKASENVFVRHVQTTQL